MNVKQIFTTLIHIRKTQIQRKHWLLLILLLILIGLPLFWWGTYEKITDSSYCATCHMMKPEIYTWEASSHNRVQCVQCHVEPEVNTPLNYRLFKAKEWYAAITGNYGLVIQATSPIPDGTCTQCHNMKNRNLTPSGDLIVPHSKHAEIGINCTMCHTGVAHGNISKKRVTFRTDYASWDESIAKNIMSDVKNLRPDMDTCMRCHAVRKAPLGCSACHTTSMLPTNHKTDIFKNGEHGKEALKDIKYCDSCHSYMSRQEVQITEGSSSKFEQFLSSGSKDPSTITIRDYAKANTFCVDCHTERPVTHDDNFQATHGSFAQKDKSRCLTCHDSRPQAVIQYGSTLVSCGSCHVGLHKRSTWRQSHPVPLPAKPRVTEYCFSCHAESQCGGCHLPKNKKSAPPLPTNGAIEDLN
ncbi:MAG: NapC/NirT family cytochrome c [Bacillota bacterium]